MFCFLSPLALLASEPVANFKGSDFRNGANQRYGLNHQGRSEVNYVYAGSNGAESSMTATFLLDKIPAKKLVLTLDARDDDSASPCDVSLSLNDTVLFSGKGVFPKKWSRKRFDIPDGTLKTGDNTIKITNLESNGPSGNAPWFMVARCSVADENYKMPTAVGFPKYTVTLPETMRDYPEPLPAGKESPFKIRGTKGWCWTPEQYLSEIPVLEKYKMNFMMNCYLSMFVDKEGHWGDLISSGRKWENAWWLPLPNEMKEKYIEVFKKAKEHNVTFCFAVHPQLGSSRPLDPNSEKDVNDYYRHFDWAQKQGIKWFSISLDDVSWGERGPAVGAQEHAKLVNTVLERLRKNDPEAQMIFCPVPYWGDGTQPDHKAYLETLAKDMHEDVYVFWTGDAVVPGKMTSKAARTYRSIVKHRLIIWENYPVNDSAPALHLGPITGRDADLCDTCDGYMSNPMYLQNESNRIPLLTCADYAWNPAAYDPDRSIGQAILHLAQTPSQREVLKELVETYPGMIICGIIGTGFNAAMARFDALKDDDDPNASKRFMETVEKLANRLEKEFPGHYRETIKTIRGDVAKMKAQLNK